MSWDYIGVDCSGLPYSGEGAKERGVEVEWRI